MRDFHPEIIEGDDMDALKNNKEAFVINLKENYK